MSGIKSGYDKYKCGRVKTVLTHRNDRPNFSIDGRNYSIDGTYENYNGYFVLLLSGYFLFSLRLALASEASESFPFR